MNPCCDLDLKNSKRIFLHDTPAHDDALHTKVGNKMFGDLEDIIRINTDILTLCCDFDPECSNPIFPQDALACNSLSLDTFSRQRISSSEDIVARVIFL